MVRFIHTSDWHMGLKSSQMGLKARAIREKRFETLSMIAEIARESKVDFIIVAGDIFDAGDVDEGVVKRTTDALNALAPIQIFILPGNHDPQGPGSIWTRPGWKGAGSHIHLLDKAEEVSATEGAILYPCPITQKRSVRDPTAWIPARTQHDRRIRIGVAHGALDVVGLQVNFPIPSNRAELSGLDYLALGDWHGCRLEGRTCYSGTPEPTAFGEHDPGNVLLVDIPAAGSVPLVEKKRVKLLHWVSEEPEINDPTDIRALEERIMEHGPLTSIVLRVHPRLGEASTQETIDSLMALRKSWEQSCFFLDFPAELLTLVQVNHDVLPDGLLAEVDTVLSSKAATGEVNPAIVAEARAILRKHLREVQM
jgi:DNA repair exonuclease SbcCD nuclease subunit